LDSKYGKEATLDQIEEQIERLTDADWMKVRKMAEGHLWGTRLGDPEDLINETLVRLIEGTRRWSPGMAFVPWLGSAMKSVADGIRNLKHVKIEALAGDMISDTDSEEVLDVFASEDRTPLDSLLTEEARKDAEATVAKIQTFFKGDEDVEWILMGIEDGLKAEDIRETSGMTLTQYESAKKRLRRGLVRQFPARMLK